MKLFELFTIRETQAARVDIQHYADDPDDDGHFEGNTEAYDAQGNILGHILWHVENDTLHIDMIQTDVNVPYLGLRLLQALDDYSRWPIDPGMMNRHGQRLWILFQARKNKTHVKLVPRTNDDRKDANDHRRRK